MIHADSGGGIERLDNHDHPPLKVWRCATVVKSAKNTKNKKAGLYFDALFSSQIAHRGAIA